MFRETSLARSQSKYERKYVDFIIYISVSYKRLKLKKT